MFVALLFVKKLNLDVCFNCNFWFQRFQAEILTNKFFPPVFVARKLFNILAVYLIEQEVDFVKRFCHFL